MIIIIAGLLTKIAGGIVNPLAFLGVIALTVFAIYYSKGEGETKKEEKSLKWFGLVKNPLTIVAVIASMVYFVLEVDVNSNANIDFKSLAIIIAGILVLISQIKGFEMPGKVGTWAFFVLTIAFVTFDILNVLLVHLGLIAEKVDSWQDVVRIFSGNYTVVSLAGLFALGLIFLWTKHPVLGGAFLLAFFTLLTIYPLYDRWMTNMSIAHSKKTQELRYAQVDIPRELSSIDEFNIEFDRDSDEIIILECGGNCILHAEGTVVVESEEKNTFFNCDPSSGCKEHKTGKRLNFYKETLEKGMPEIATQKKLQYGQMAYSTDGVNFQEYTGWTKVPAQKIYIVRWVHTVVESVKRSEGTGWLIGTYQDVKQSTKNVES